MEYGFILWTVIIIASIAVEAMTAQLVAIWFMPAAVVALIASIFTDNFIIQIGIFLVCAVLSLVFCRKAVARFLLKKPYEPTNLDIIIGKVAVVTERIDNDLEQGEVKIAGKRWSARSHDGKAIDVDSKVTVLRIEGVKLICSPCE